MEEHWKNIEGYEGLYQVSNLGRVKSLERVDIYTLNGEIIKRPRKEKILYQQDNHGYKRVSLGKDCKMKWFAVHILQMKAFVPNPNNLPQVNHKDEDKANNFIWVNKDGSVDLEKSNLEWCTASYNVNYGTRNKKARDNFINRKDLSTPVYCSEMDKTFPSIMQASRETHIQFASIQRCVSGKQKHTYKDNKCYTWRYAS